MIVGVIPAVLVYRTEIRFQTPGREIRNRLICFLIGLLSVGAIASVSYKEYASFGRNNKQVRYYINTFNYIYAVGRYYKRAMDAGRKFVILDDAPRIVADRERKPRVMVLIVGETARAQNFRFTVTDGKRIRCFQKQGDCYLWRRQFVRNRDGSFSALYVFASDQKKF